MWKLKNSLNNELLKYFLLFSALILGILWIFQFLFFNSLYRNQKINDVKYVASTIKKKQHKQNFENIINNLAFDHSVCVEIVNQNYDSLYRSSFLGKGCFSNKKNTSNYKFDFVNSNEQEKAYELINQEFGTNSLVYALRLQNNEYAFIDTSLDPVDGTVSLIRKELIIFTLIIIVLSFTLAYFLSNYIAKPIKKINNEAKKLAKGNFNINFENSNILELKELSETLNYAKEELNKTEELRRDLMANVSHDLKTPLTMIKAYAEMATDLHKDNPIKQKEDSETIINEVDRLTLLVNDILDLSKLESLKNNLNIKEFDLITTIENILKRYEVLKIKEQYNFKFVHKNKKILVQADEKKLEQVIYNLINNAINYTGEDNTVTIKVTANKTTIKIEVIDTGKGIKEEDLPYIWNKYYKNQKKHKRNLIGTGLGLSIVKNILEDHHFNYGVISKKDQGTTFYFEIPKKQED